MRKLNIKKLKKLISNNHIFVDYDMVLPIAKTSTNQFVEAITIVITDYNNPEQQIVNFLLKHSAKLFKFYKLDETTLYVKDKPDSGRDIRKATNISTINPNNYEVTNYPQGYQVTIDLIKFAYTTVLHI